MGSKTKQSLVTGAAILGSAALLIKLLGAVYRIPYQNITGDVGLAIYNKVYPLYSMLLILATAGFPIAISKIVSERLAVGDKKGAKRVFIISIYILTLSGFLFFALLFFGSDFIARLMGNIELSIAIKSVSFALLIVPIMAAFRGYYQGHQYMTPTALSQVGEQLIRVITILILSYWLMNNGYGVYYAGAGAVFGATTGAIISFAILLLYWKKINAEHEETEVNLNINHDQETLKTIILRVLYYSVPIAAGALALPLLGVVDSFSVTNIINYSVTHSEGMFGIYIKGQTLVQNAEYWFGIYTRGQPLVQFAAFFATALFLALVPSISEAHAHNDSKLIAKRSELALRLTLLIGLPASVGLSILAEPVNIMLYRNNVGSLTMALLSYTTIFSTLFVTTSGILQGIGKVVLPAKNLSIGIIFKLLSNILLVYYFHVNGAAIATVLTYGIVTMLNIHGINKHVGLKIGFINFFIKPIFATVIMGVIVFISKELLIITLETVIDSERLLMSFVALLAVGLGVIAFVFGLFISKTLVRRDLEQIPRFGSKLIRVTEKLRILKD